jgi:hypothetical protein
MEQFDQSGYAPKTLMSMKAPPRSRAIGPETPALDSLATTSTKKKRSLLNMDQTVNEIIKTMGGPTTYPTEGSIQSETNKLYRGILSSRFDAGIRLSKVRSLVTTL